MTTKQKTGDQLMASIRKAKTGAAGTDKAAGSAPSPAAGTKKATTAKARPAAAATTATRPRRATKKKVAAKPKASQTDNTGYQSSGRVWPD